MFKQFLDSFAFLSLVTAVVACGVYAPWALAPLALWFVVAVAREVAISKSL